MINKSNNKKPLKDGNITQIVKINIDNDNDVPKRKTKRRSKAKTIIDPNTLPVSMPFNDVFVKEPTRSTMFRQNIPTMDFNKLQSNPNTMNINIPPHNTTINNNMPTMPDIPDYSGVILNLTDLYTQALTPQIHTNLPKPVSPPATPYRPVPPLLSTPTPSPAAGAPGAPSPSAPGAPLPPMPPLNRRPAGDPQVVTENTLVAYINRNYALANLQGYAEARKILEIAKARFPAKNWGHYEQKLKTVNH